MGIVKTSGAADHRSSSVRQLLDHAGPYAKHLGVGQACGGKLRTNHRNVVPGGEGAAGTVVGGGGGRDGAAGGGGR